ncbi:MAG TPA: glycosyltransferase family 39 protein [Anaerolineales bacterium]|nr:glycosyltransferase family 39 protein [Anaerolineales bacterium]
MEEPSVLDYLKSKLFPWKYPAIHLPDDETVIKQQTSGDIPVLESELAPSDPASHPPSAQDLPGVEKSAGTEQISPTDNFILRGPSWNSAQKSPKKHPNRWPWLSLLALLFAILGQAGLSPSPERSWTPGIYFLIIAFVLAAVATWRKEWMIRPLPEEDQHYDPAKFRPRDLIIGIILAILAFLSFSNLLFTGFNLALLLAALVFTIRAFWYPTRKSLNWYDLRTRIHKDQSIKIVPDQLIKFAAKTALVIAAIGLVAFFRFYSLDQTPPEMNSDHAEKILDISNVLQGYTQIFFPNNGGREALHMYLAAGLHKYLHIPLGFDLLKLSTMLVGFLSLPFFYLVGKEMGGARVGMLAFLFAGVAYWPNVVSRVGLRLPFYILFTASTMYFLLLGFRRGSRNDFIWAGISLGLSLYGYSADRILPVLVLAAFGLYLLHPHSREKRPSLVLSLLVVILVSFILFLPLFRYIIEQPDNFLFRTLTRMGSLERPVDQSPVAIFFNNYARAFGMFSWSAGVIWPASIPNYPALGVVSGALFYLGVALISVRYLRKRNWQDLFILLAIPILFLPSVLSIAFPSENPSLYRTGGASVPVFLLVAIALDGLIFSIQRHIKTFWSKWFAWGVIALLFIIFAVQEYDWVFNKYALQYRTSAWNTSEMGAVAKNFMQLTSTEDTVWVMGVPHWADTRLVAIQAGFPTRDFALFSDQIHQTLDDPRSKLFIVRPDDETSIHALKQAYPSGWFQRFRSYAETKDFLIFIVPAKKTP